LEIRPIVSASGLTRARIITWHNATISETKRQGKTLRGLYIVQALVQLLVQNTVQRHAAGPRRCRGNSPDSLGPYECRYNNSIRTYALRITHYALREGVDV